MRSFQLIKFIRKIITRYRWERAYGDCGITCPCAICGRRVTFCWGNYLSSHHIFENRGGKGYVLIFCSEECKKKFWEKHDKEWQNLSIREL